MKRIVLLLILLSVSIFNYAFNLTVTISTNPVDAKIFLDGEYVGEGHYEFELNVAKIFIITVKKDGYKSVTKKYKYRANNNPEYIDYNRWDNINAYIVLEKESIRENTTENSSVNKLKLLSMVESFKTEDLITADEYLLLKDKLLSDNEDYRYIKRCQELSKINKMLLSSFITKEDFIIIKNNVLNNNFTDGNYPSDKLSELKRKTKSGYYSKEEIGKLKKQLVNSYM